MGLKVTTDGRAVTIYRQDKTSQGGNSYTQYSIGVASKDRDGNWINGFIDCQFKKGVEIANKSKIHINNAFYTVSEYNGKKYYKLFIMEYEVEEGGEPAPRPAPDDFMQISDSDLENMPFT